MPDSGSIASIVRYPVKSMAGEVLGETRLTPDGLADDRLYAFESSEAPPGMLRLTGPARREMLRYRPRLRDGVVCVDVPTEETFAVDSPALLGYLQAHLPDTGTLSLTRSSTPQTDVRPLSLISLQTIAQLAAEAGQPLHPHRFRANLYLDLPGGAFGEDALVGETLAIGASATLLVRERDPRCRFITYDPVAPHLTAPLFSLMKLLERRHQGRAGVYASVLTPGAIRAGDPIRIVSAGRYAEST